MKFFNKTMLLLTLTAVSSQVFAADAGQKGLAADQAAFNAYDKVYEELQKKGVANFTAEDFKKFRNVLRSLSGISDAGIRALIATSKANLAKEIPGLKALKDELKAAGLVLSEEDLDLDKGLILNHAIAKNQLPLAKKLVAYGAKVENPGAFVTWISNTYGKDAKKFAEYADMIAWVKTLQPTAAAK